MLFRKSNKKSKMTISPFETEEIYSRYSHLSLVEQCSALDFFMNHYKDENQKLRERIRHSEKTSMNYTPYEYYQRFGIEKVQKVLSPTKREPHFWTVFKPGGIATKMHKSYEEAEKEAKRLAEKQPGDTFFVMQVKSEHKAEEIPQYKHDDKYYG